MEEWRAIEGTNGMYEVSNTGKVRSNNYLGHGVTKEIKPHVKKSGYVELRIYINGKRKSCRLHRLVADAFIPNLENKPQVNHKDGNKQNNYVDNLEWSTASENIRHAVQNGLRENAREKARERGKITILRMHELQKTPIIATCIETGEETYFDSQQEAAEKLHLNKSKICCVVKGQRNRTGGYSFRYANKGVMPCQK